MIKFTCQQLKQIETLSTDVLVCPVFTSKSLNPCAKAIDEASQGLVKALVKSGDISAKAGHTQTLLQAAGLKAKRIVFIGAGDAKAFDADALLQWLHTCSSTLASMPVKQAHIFSSDLANAQLSLANIAQFTSRVLSQEQYQYSAGLSQAKDAPKLSQVKLLQFEKPNTQAMNQAIKQGQAMASGIKLARELGDLPGNICTPSYLADVAKDMAKSSAKLSCKVLSEKQMQSLKMGSFLSVSAGSNEPAKLIALEYKGTKANVKPHVLVGKGVTFDSGGISIKPSAKMEEMKFDMCGAAAVIGTMQTLIELEPEINVVVLVGATENLPSGIATKPGDVVTSMSGKTIEVINTDAEGRLVLCDVLSYSHRYQPQSIIDVATLTGACVVALGSHATAVYSNQDSLAEDILHAANSTRDKAWHMPLWPEYDKQLESAYADMKNVGGPEGGSVTAACFLARFNEDQKWAHLDIAGTAWATPQTKGATGRPVALLSQYLLNQAS